MLLSKEIKYYKYKRRITRRFNADKVSASLFEVLVLYATL